MERGYLRSTVTGSGAWEVAALNGHGEIDWLRIAAVRYRRERAFSGIAHFLNTRAETY